MQKEASLAADAEETAVSELTSRLHWLEKASDSESKMSDVQFAVEFAKTMRSAESFRVQWDKAAVEVAELRESVCFSYCFCYLASQIASVFFEDQCKNLCLGW